jgi:hypothetical protein
MNFLSRLFVKVATPSKVMRTEVRTTTLPAGQNVDRAIMEQLRNAGLDLSNPFHIRHIFSAPTGDAARELQRELESRGLKAESSEESGRWKIAATEELILEEASIAAERAQFQSLAGNLGGSYAGWELKTTQKRSIEIG